MDRKKKKTKKPAKQSDLMSETQDWSKLCPDILRPILESLSSLDFDRAKQVCSDWYSVRKTCVRQPLCPWQVTYQGDSSMLFDPDKYKNYQPYLPGLYGKTYCMASSGDWFLLVNPSLNFFVVNLLTRKLIELPVIHSSIVKGYDGEDIVRSKSLAVLWMNESTNDYVVAWIFKRHYLFSLKKGDDSWRDWNSKRDDPYLNLDDTMMMSYYDMAYKNGGLYMYTLDHNIKICGLAAEYSHRDDLELPEYIYPFNFVEQPCEHIWKRRIVIQDSEEVLIVLSLKEVIHDEEKLLFYVFKMNFESEQWERVYSIGDDEVLIFGHGVTMKAPVQDVGDGIKSNTICFVEDDIWPNSDRPSNCGVFDLATSKITWPKRFGAYIDQTQWFIPRFA